MTEDSGKKILLEQKEKRLNLEIQNTYASNSGSKIGEGISLGQTAGDVAI